MGSDHLLLWRLKVHVNCLPDSVQENVSSGCLDCIASPWIGLGRQVVRNEANDFCRSNLKRCQEVYLEVSGLFDLWLVVPASLHRVCYERVPWYPTVFTFILSALWHGVYPGYYFTFLTGILVTVAARTVSLLWLWGLFLSNVMSVCLLSFSPIRSRGMRG